MSKIKKGILKKTAQPTQQDIDKATTSITRFAINAIDLRKYDERDKHSFKDTITHQEMNEITTQVQADLSNDKVNVSDMRKFLRSCAKQAGAKLSLRDRIGSWFDDIRGNTKKATDNLKQAIGEESLTRIADSMDSAIKQRMPIKNEAAMYKYYTDNSSKRMQVIQNYYTEHEMKEPKVHTKRKMNNKIVHQIISPDLRDAAKKAMKGRSTKVQFKESTDIQSYPHPRYYDEQPVDQLKDNPRKKGDINCYVRADFPRSGNYKYRDNYRN